MLTASLQFNQSETNGNFETEGRIYISIFNSIPTRSHYPQDPSPSGISDSFMNLETAQRPRRSEPAAEKIVKFLGQVGAKSHSSQVGGSSGGAGFAAGERDVSERAGKGRGSSSGAGGRATSSS